MPKANTRHDGASSTHVEDAREDRNEYLWVPLRDPDGGEMYVQVVRILEQSEEGVMVRGYEWRLETYHDQVGYTRTSGEWIARAGPENRVAYKRRRLDTWLLTNACGESWVNWAPPVARPGLHRRHRS